MRAIATIALLGLTTHVTKPSMGILAGPIVPGSLTPLVVAVDAQREGDSFSLFISSGGGIVEEAKRLMVSIDHAKGRGANIKCYVTDQAESSAFWILTHCTERYALPESMLMFHHIFITSAEDVTAADAGRMQTELQMLDDEYLDDIQAVCDISRPQLRAWMDAGTEWTAAAMDRAMPGVLTGIESAYPIRIRINLGGPGK